MRILLLSEDKSIFIEDNSPGRKRILELASFLDLLFVVIATSFERNSVRVKQVAKNTWIYQTNSIFKFLRPWNAFKLASFEASAREIFQADLIVCEDLFSSAFAGYLLSRKFKRPLYIYLSEADEKKIFVPRGVANFFLSKIAWFVLRKADCIKVDSMRAEERMFKKSSAFRVQAIRPYIDEGVLKAAKTGADEEVVENNLIRKKFPQFGFTAVAFVDNLEQIELSLNILKKLNTRFPPSSLVFLFSENLENVDIARVAGPDLRPFVVAVPLGDDLSEYLASANVFFALASGEKYQEVLGRACSVGAKIIALESEISKKLIEDNVTGFICPAYTGKEMVDYFADKTIFLMEHPGIGFGFKINVSLVFKGQFSDTKEEYLKKLKSSWEGCVETYKKSHEKYYSF